MALLRYGVFNKNVYLSRNVLINKIQKKACTLNKCDAKTHFIDLFFMHLQILFTKIVLTNLPKQKRLQLVEPLNYK